MENQNQKVQLTKSDLNACFSRSNLLQGSWNFERMQALGYCFGIVPAIRRLYPEGSQERKDAIKRHLEFYNTQPFVTAPILGVNLAMEEQRANGAPIDDAAINGVKVGLMGPPVSATPSSGVRRAPFSLPSARVSPKAAACSAPSSSSSSLTPCASSCATGVSSTATKKAWKSSPIWAAVRCKKSLKRLPSLASSSWARW